MDVEGSHKSWTARNFRQFISLKNVEVCPIIASIENFPYFKGYLNWFRNTFPGLVHKCPYKELLVINATHTMYENEQQNYMHELLNGLNKGKIMSVINIRHFIVTFEFSARFRFHDKFDGNIFQMTYVVDTKVPGKSFEYWHSSHQIQNNKITATNIANIHKYQLNRCWIIHLTTKLTTIFNFTFHSAQWLVLFPVILII